MRITTLAVMVAALCRTTAPSAMPRSAQTGARRADATTTRCAPGWSIGTPTCRPDRTAWVRANEVIETTAPNTVVTAVTTHTFAAITERRAGTAVNVVRISPVLYSPTIAVAPMALRASMRIMAAFPVKAIDNGIPSRTNSPRVRESCIDQYRYVS